MMKNKKEILIAIKEEYYKSINIGDLMGLCTISRRLSYIYPFDLISFKEFLEARRPKNLRYFIGLFIYKIDFSWLSNFPSLEHYLMKIDHTYWWDIRDTTSRIEFLDKLIDTYTITEGMELLYNYVSLFKEDSSELPGLTDILDILPLKKEDTFLLMFYLINHESVFTLMFFKNKSILFKKGLYDDKKRYLKYHINKLKQSLQ